MSECKDCDCNGGGKFILGALLGTVVGAIAGVLMAPKSGKETRHDIAEGAKKAGSKAKAAGAKIAKRGKKAEIEEEVEEDDE